MSLESKVEKFSQGKFMQGLQKFSVTLSNNEAFSSLATGMGSTMGIIMIGAVVQIFSALGGLIFGWQAGEPLYDSIYMIYTSTMGMIGIFMCFSLAYNYSKRLDLAPLQSGFTALVCYVMVVSLPRTATLADGTEFLSLDLNALGSTGIFVAILIGMLSVRISKFVIDHNWVIKLPESVPEGVLNSFNNIIPAGINIIIWYGLSLLIAQLTNGALTLSTIITYGLSVPLSYLTSPIGIVVLIILAQLFWFFGIHGNTIVFAAILIPYIEAYNINAELAAAGEPLVFNAIFLYGAVAYLGGSGNTLPLVILGLKSKSKQVKAMSRASIGPALFNINEPMIFGYPIMYNPVMLIPFILAPLVSAVLFGIAYVTGLIALPQVLILSSLPIFLSEFMTTLSISNVIFALVVALVCFGIWYPFFKIYEKQCIEKESSKLDEQMR